MRHHISAPQIHSSCPFCDPQEAPARNLDQPNQRTGRHCSPLHISASWLGCCLVYLGAGCPSEVRCQEDPHDADGEHGRRSHGQDHQLAVGNFQWLRSFKAGMEGLGWDSERKQKISPASDLGNLQPFLWEGVTTLGGEEIFGEKKQKRLKGAART